VQGLFVQFQLVGFHPDFVFAEAPHTPWAGPPEDDPCHYTNRSPYPMLHILRQKSVKTAAESHTDSRSVSEANELRLRDMGKGELDQLLEPLRVDGASMQHAALPPAMKKTFRTLGWEGVKASAVSVALWMCFAQPALAVASVLPSHGGQFLLRKGLCLKVAKTAAAALSAWIAFSLKQAGAGANPQRSRGGTMAIRCPWPFVLVALPWTDIGRRSLSAGFHDWQTWAAIALVLLLR